MRAAFYRSYGPAAEVLEHGEIESRAPGHGEVRVALRTSGINPYDVKFRAGVYTPTLPKARIVPHCDGAGVVEAVGEDVDTSRLGQRVWIWGALGAFDGTAAEAITLPSAQAPSLPDELSFEAGACLGIPFLTAYQNVLRDGSVAGQTILVAGGGGAVGFLATQLARLSGARVIATAGTAKTIAHAEAAGAQAVIHYREEDVAERVAELSDGGVDRIIEVEFGRNLPLVTRLLKQGGIVSSYGSAARMKPTLDFGALQAHGVTLHFRSVHTMNADLRRAAISALPELVAKGLRIPPVETFSLDDIVAAHRAVEAGAGVRRVVLEV